MDLTTTLIAAGSGDQNAEAQLNNWKDENFVDAINALAAELCTEGKDVRARQLAGIYLKNLLHANDEARQKAQHEAWKSISDEVRAPAKNQLLQALRSPVREASQVAAQACAEVAVIEVPYGAWPEFLHTTLETVVTHEVPELAKIAALTCLGYALERMAEIDFLPEIPKPTSDQMLTTIVEGIQTNKTDNVRKAAAVALKNSLLFSHNNFENADERKAIMDNICEATKSANADVRKGAFDCLATVAYHFYEKLPDYLTIIYDLTTTAIRNDQDIVVTAALEFWNAIAECESEMIYEEQDLQSQGIAIDTPCPRYTAQVVPPLVPLLLEAMTKQEEGADPDTDQFGRSQAAATCLRLIALTVEDQITNIVINFVHQHIKNQDWHFREAAIMAFSCCLEGASPEAMATIVSQSIPVLMESLNDPVPLVKDTALYAISKVCEFHARAIPANVLPTLVNGLIVTLGAEHPHVAHQAANALHKLGSAFDGESGEEQTNQLSPFLTELFAALMKAADRPDAGEASLRVGAFEAVNVFVANSALDCQPIILELMRAATDRLRASFGLNMDSDSKEGLVGLLCGLVQVLCQKLETADVEPHADNIMQSVLQVFQGGSNNAHTEAFLVMSAIADKMGEGFMKYMQAVEPILQTGLKQYHSFQVCNVAVSVVGDICRALGPQFGNFATNIMEALVECLKDSAVHRSIKPNVLSCFGDVALALAAGYEPFLQITMMLLLQASATDVAQEDDEMIDYCNLLRESVLEGLTGIIGGLEDGARIDLFTPYVPPILNFLHSLSSDANMDDELLGKAIGVVGDIGRTCKHIPATQDALKQEQIANLIQKGGLSTNSATRDLASWAHSVVQSL